jgi:prepilin-type N-terminal cleavage/methylation domain-containing protein
MTKRAGFTLIEVMVAVMIVSVVVGALLEMRGNISHKIFGLEKITQVSQYDTLLLGENDYGKEKSNISMKALVEDFELESDLRRKLSAMKLHISYEVLGKIDTSEFDDTSSLIFEIGKSHIVSDTSYSSSFVRIGIE